MSGIDESTGFNVVKLEAICRQQDEQQRRESRREEQGRGGYGESR